MKSDREVAALVASVEGTVRVIAKQFGVGRTPDEMEDMYAAGRMGATVAAGRFDQDHALRASFCTYASYWIRAHVAEQLLFFRGRGRIGRSSTAATAIFRHARARRSLERQGIEPTPEELAAEMGMSQGEFLRVMSVVGPGDLFLDAPARMSSGDRRRDNNALDFFADESVPDVLGELCHRASCQDLSSAMDGLNDRERFVIEQRFFRGRMLPAIGRDLGVTGSRAQQLEVQAIKKLRKIMTNQ